MVALFCLYINGWIWYEVTKLRHFFRKFLINGLNWKKSLVTIRIYTHCQHFWHRWPFYKVKCLCSRGRKWGREGCYSHQYTEVGRAFLIHFQKIFLNKVYIHTMMKIARKLKFYTWMATSGSKSVKKGQNILKKATIRSYTWFFWFFLPWLIWYISIVIIWRKNFDVII